MWKIKENETSLLEKLFVLRNTSPLKSVEVSASDLNTESTLFPFLLMPQVEQQISIKNAHEEIASLTKRIAELEMIVKQGSSKPKDVDALTNKFDVLANEVGDLAQFKADLKHLHLMNAYNAKDVTKQGPMKWMSCAKH